MRVLSVPLLCDECKQPIERYSEGMVEWIDDNEAIRDVRIVHNPAFSPKGDCYKHTNEYHRQENHLSVVLSDQGLRKQLGLV